MWLEILHAQVKARGLGSVATDLDYSKATLSLVLNGKYSSDTTRLEAAVLATFGTINCPFEDISITAEVCKSWQSRDLPTSSAWSIRHWAACQACPHNTSLKES